MVKAKEWYRTREGMLITMLVSLLLVYGFASWAIDSGNLLHYLLTLVLFGYSISRLFKVVKG